jgi:hypothetical protein
MHKFSYVLGCLLGASALAIALPGYADIPPVDYCSVEGSTCNNADGVDKAGICSAAQCSRRLPDGTFMTYACFHCVAPGGEGGAGAGGEGGAGGGGAPPPLTGGTTGTTGGAATSTGGKASTTGGSVNATGGKASTTGGSANATGGSAGASGKTGKDDDGGCSLTPLGAERGLAGLMAALGLSALFLSRRRR